MNGPRSEHAICFQGLGKKLSELVWGCHVRMKEQYKGKCEGGRTLQRKMLGSLVFSILLIW